MDGAGAQGSRLGGEDVRKELETEKDDLDARLVQKASVLHVMTELNKH